VSLGPGRPGGGQGALVVGGDYRALGVVRSLGRRGIPVWVLRPEGDHRVAALSRFNRRTLTLPDDDASRLAFLGELSARENLAGWTVFPTADATAAFVARHHDRLAETFRLTTPDWDVFRWAYDKRLTYQLAAALNVPHPTVCTPRDRDDLDRYAGPFPAILKPATKPRLKVPAVKAWPVRDRTELRRRYDEVAALVEPGTLMVQELIPDIGGQLSVAALCRNGEPLVCAVAVRVRQYPMDFGRSSTYVETVVDPDVGALARQVLSALRLDGLVEVEFKRDPRDGLCKLLDINVRAWGWHTIGAADGFDFTYRAWQLANGRPFAPVEVPAGLRWLRFTTDLPVAYREIISGRLPLWSYLRTLASRHDRAVAAMDDPMPAVLEIPLYIMSRRGRHRG
jgi:D-aspartate ligase